MPSLPHTMRASELMKLRGFDNDVTFKFILRLYNIHYVQLNNTRQMDLSHSFLYSTLNTSSRLSHFMDSLQDSGSSILVAPVSSYRLMSAAIGARDTGSRGEIQVLIEL